MATPNLEDVAEFADNPEERCACVLLLDVSNSMSGENIQRINDATMAFKGQVSADRLAALRADIAIVAFNHTIRVVSDFATVHDIEPPVLTASGGTKIAGAVNRALDMLDRRKQEYRKNNIGYYRSIVVLLTDGYPEHDTPEEIAQASRRIAEEEAGRHVAFFAFGVEGADWATLARIATPERPPLRIESAQIGDIFQWLANSVSVISTSQPGERLALPTPPGLTDF